MGTNKLHRMALILHHFFLGSLIVFIFCTVPLDSYSVRQEEQLNRITKYEVVTPHRLEGRQRKHVNTLDEDGHLKETSFILPIMGEDYILDLYKNEMLFAEGYMERTYTEGNITINKLPHRTHHCYYHGRVRGSNSSRVALSTCNGLSGIIYLDAAAFYLQPLQDSISEHIIYQPEHIIRDKPLFNYEEDYPEDFLQQGEERMREIEKRHRERVRRDDTTETKYIELVMVADSKEFEKRGSVSAVQERTKAIVNIMDMIYLAVNTRVALASVITWESDPFDVSTNPSTALGQFQKWREEFLVPRVSHDNAQLLTGLNFDGSTVGMAALGTMCSRDRSCGVTQDHGNHENDVASTMAHEMGHNLGLNHDKKECVCESAGNIGCVMSASSGSNPPLNWSSCSVEEFAERLDHGLGACMFNYPKLIFGGPICQNGFLEEGEECDCGPAEICDNPCCVAETCTLHENATCASGACCNDCQLQQSGHLCRDKMNECDLPEYCTGDAEECPANVYRQNGMSCQTTATTSATCFNGMCTSYDQQCKQIWGDNAQVAHNKCWRYNQQGSTFGNCGRNEDGSIAACSKTDKMCGKLLCEGGAGFPLLGSLAEASQGFIYDENGRKRVCKAASLDQGEDIPDPGYVSDGSPCFQNMFCYENRCINSTQAGITPCPENCNGNGICNSESHCHCDDNWAPPTCSSPGHGGSVDSGPTIPITPGESGTTISTTTTVIITGTEIPPFSIVVAVIVGGILIAAVVLLLALVYWKRNSIKKKLLSTKRWRHSQSDATCKYAAVKIQESPRKIYRPKHAPPSTPSGMSNGSSGLKIQHPAHISGSPPSYDGQYMNFQEQLSPNRVAPTPPSKDARRTSWNLGPRLSPSAPPIKYQRHDDAIMYDEPPKVDFVDPSIPRVTNHSPLPAANQNGFDPGSDESQRYESFAENAVEASINRFNRPPAPPSKPNQSKPLKPPSVDGGSTGVLKPTHAAPKPPSFRPNQGVEPEQTLPSNIETQPAAPPGQTQPATPLQPPLKPRVLLPVKPPGQVPLKPPGQVPLKPPGQGPLKPPGQAPLKPPGQAPLKPPGQVPLKPPGQVPLKPPGQGPLKPPGQVPLKPPVLQTPPKPASLPPTVLPASKPVPASRKPVLPGKPSVPGKPVVPSKRPALRPVVPSDQQKNWNNSASSSSPTDHSSGETSSINSASSKPMFRGPPPPEEPSIEVKTSVKPTPPPKPVKV
ncbi:disintegrin and metalloproteinase domain-containing protein 12-like isoform X2 [Apostichopus japonicus]|uniref:disintegrin and metalloproteinase domain-containing protein 12-like isoform X2 n=1 Tax=Stichopus japonicus TaxID=307972 RepID=UPI003AB7B6B9